MPSETRWGLLPASSSLAYRGQCVGLGSVNAGAAYVNISLL